MADKQHGGAPSRSARKSGVVGILLIASLAIAWLAGALARPAAADHGGSHAAQGYFLADSGGHMTRFGEAMDTGSLLGSTLQSPIVDGDTTPSGNGSVLVASDGGVFAFGDAPFLGSMAGAPLAAPIVTIEMTATGRGYLMAAADGGVFAFGDARFRGSLGGLRLNQPIVDMALNATNDGYLLAAADGGVFAFGQSRFRGSMGGRPLNKPIVGILPGETTGYGLVASDGGIFAFGGFVFRGSLGSLTLQAPIVDAVVSSTGDGYNMVAADGGVFAFGDAPFVGSLARLPLPRPIVTILGLGNQPPKAEDDTYTATEDTVLTRNAASGVLANDTDRDGDTLTAAVATGPTKGTLVLNANGSFTYTPNANTNGADSFTYTVSDPHGKRDTGTVSITVNAVNDPPVAANDAGTTNEDTPLVVAAPGVLANDTDVEGSALTAAVVAGPTKGTLVLNSNGSFTYTPNANTNGADSFTYRANDGTANSNVATVSLTVNAVNDAPVAVNDVRTTNEDTVLNVAAPGVLANDTDVEGSPLTAALVSGPSHGTLTLNPNGSFSYTPNANYNGADSFTYRANDGTANSNVATVSLTVNSVNDAPVAVNDAHATNEDTPLVVAAPGVLANDTDIEGSALTATVVAVPTKGTLVLNGNGSFTYTPNANANGADSFTYRANDGTANSNVATVSLTVNAVNDAPAAVNDAYATNEDTPLTVTAPGVLGNDSDVEGSPITAVLVAGPAKGTLTLNANGSFIYTPNANTNGADSFTYKASDGVAQGNTATVSLTVTAVNDAPVAVNDSHTTNEDTALNVAAPGVLGNDTDVDGNPLTAVLVTGPAKGTLTLNANGSFSYTPNANTNGADSFTYRANDGTANSNVATVSLTVNAVNDAPVAVNDAYTTNEDTPLTVTAPGVLANDSDTEGNALTAVLVTGPAKGALTLNANGSFTYTPSANTNGADSFTYKANDSAADSNVATVSLTVTAVNDAPVAVNDSYSTDEDTALNVVAPGVLANDTDVEGPKSAVLVSGPTKGTLTLNTNGSFTYMPTANYHGADSFTYKVNDGAADSGVATVALTVNSVNDAPIAVNDSYSTGEDTPLTVTAPGVLVNDSDIESAVTAVLGTGPSHGTLTLNANGSFTYTPAANYAGADSFTYRASDGTAQSNLATVSLTVNGANDAPVAVNDAYSTDEDTPLNVVAPAVLANDTDVDGNSLTAVLVSGPSKGTLTLNANGSFTYTPNANTNGADSFTYKANDGSADSNVATVSLTVNAVNDAPVALDDAYATSEDTNLVVSAPGVLDNDTDVEGPLSATSFGDAVNGAVTGNADGSFTFTPNANFSGTASFGYTVSDGTLTDTGAVTITVSPVNDAPAAGNNNFLTNEDTPFTVTAPGVLANDTDAEGDSLTATKLSDPTLGVVAFNADGSFTYTPNANANGVDSFTYKANDGSADSNTATVFITVDAVNDLPVAVDDGPYNTVQNQNLTVPAAGVLTNDTDADGQALTAGNASDPANGTVTLNANGSFSYTPDTGFTGTDTFTYDVSDGTATDTGLVTINVNPPNATPTADATSASGNEDGGAMTVTLTGHDTDDDNLTFTVGTASKGLVTEPVPGDIDCTTVANTCTVTVSYTPSPDLNGGDSFTYTVNDGFATSGAATATLTVNAVNDEPTFTKGSDQTVNEDSGAQTVNGWATGISAGPANESAQAVTFTVTTDNDGMFSTLPAVSSAGNLTYTAATNANGSATVSVTPVDDGGTANAGDDTGATKTFTITVTAVNDAPSFTKGSDQTVNEDAGAQSISNWATAISKGPADESAQTLSFTTSNDNNALFSVQPGVTPTGTLVYTSAPNIYGSATVTIYLSDNGGATNGGDDTSDSQTFVITVNAVNDAPVAAAKSFDVQTNMKRSLGGLLTGATDNNDVAGDPAWTTSYTLGSITAGAGCVGCTISNVDTANGSFDFEPPAGGTGTYTVTYTVVDSGHPAPGVASASQTITFTVSGPVIWFADASSGDDTSGTGTLTRPFATLTKVATVDAPGHRVFVHPGTYAAGISLTNNEWLVGAGTKAASFDDLMGITPPSGTVARPAVNGTNPTVQSSVALGADNTVRGLTLTGANALTGTSFGTLVTGVGSSADVVLNSTGQALSLTTGTITGDFVSTTSSGGTDNVFLSGVNTTTATSLGAGALSGATSEGFQVIGGTGTFTYAGTVANAAGTTVSIANKTGGTVTFNGAVSDFAGAGVSLTTNTGATIAFNGGVTLTSGASPAFVATGGGTVSVVGAANTLASTTGTALNVANTTIGAADLTFRSISANGAATGINLESTGSSGGLVVSGTGSAGTGGAIANSGADGIRLSNTRDTSLSWMTINSSAGSTAGATCHIQSADDCSAGIDMDNATNVTLNRISINGSGQQGISGHVVNGLTITNSTVDNAGNANDEFGMLFSQLSGTVLIQDTVVDHTAEGGIRLYKDSGSLSMTLRRVTLQNNDVTIGEDGFQGEIEGTATATILVDDSDFQELDRDGVDFIVEGAATANLTVKATTVQNNEGAGITVAANNTSNLKLNVENNVIKNLVGNSVNVVGAVNSTVHTTITGNTISHPTAPSAQGGYGIRLSQEEDGDFTARVESNNVSGTGFAGIRLLGRLGELNSSAGTANADTGTLHAYVRNNTVGMPLNPDYGIEVNVTGVENAGCFVYTGNSATGNTVGGVRARQNTSSVFRVEGLTLGSNDGIAMASYLNANNTSSPTASAAGTFTGVAANTCRTATAATLP